MATPYPDLTPIQLTVAKALAASPRWRGRAGPCARRHDGSLVELRTPAALARRRGPDQPPGARNL